MARKGYPAEFRRRVIELVDQYPSEWAGAFKHRSSARPVVSLLREESAIGERPDVGGDRLQILPR